MKKPHSPFDSGYAGSLADYLMKQPKPSRPKWASNQKCPVRRAAEERALRAGKLVSPSNHCLGPLGEEQQARDRRDALKRGSIGPKD